MTRKALVASKKNFIRLMVLFSEDYSFFIGLWASKLNHTLLNWNGELSTKERCSSGPARKILLCLISNLFFPGVLTPYNLLRQVLRKSVMGSFFQLSDSNPGRLGTKRERYRCAMPYPQFKSFLLINYWLIYQMNIR